MERKFGIEIEFACSQRHEAFAETLTANNVPVDRTGIGGYHHTNGNTATGWQLKYDSTIRGRGNNRYGIEMVSKPLAPTDENFAEVRRAIETANANGSVNVSCGFHVHVDCTGINETKKNRVRELWNSAEHVITTMLPTSRRHSQWCRRGSSDRNRYVALNLVALGVHNTIEFRCHQGTLNADKAIAWIKFCVGIIEYALDSDKELPARFEIVSNPNPQTTPAAPADEQTRNDQLFVRLGRATYEINRTALETQTLFSVSVVGGQALGSYEDLNDALFQITRHNNPSRSLRVRPGQVARIRRAMNENASSASAPMGWRSGDVAEPDAPVDDRQSISDHNAMRALCRLLEVDDHATRNLARRYEAALNNPRLGAANPLGRDMLTR